LIDLEIPDLIRLKVKVRKNDIPLLPITYLFPPFLISMASP
jgi:hypothetical protein